LGINPTLCGKKQEHFVAYQISTNHGRPSGRDEVDDPARHRRQGRRRKYVGTVVVKNVTKPLTAKYLTGVRATLKTCSNDGKHGFASRQVRYLRISEHSCHDYGWQVVFVPNNIFRELLTLVDWIWYFSSLGRMANGAMRLESVED